MHLKSCLFVVVSSMEVLNLGACVKKNSYLNILFCIINFKCYMILVEY